MTARPGRSRCRRASWLSTGLAGALLGLAIVGGLGAEAAPVETGGGELSLGRELSLGEALALAL